MRVVPEHQRSLALGFGSALYRTVGAIPGPLVTGAILDSDCQLWERDCNGDKGGMYWYSSSVVIVVVYSVVIVVV